MATREASTSKAVIFGCAGPGLTETERDFFASTKPWGFILFKRNCVAAAQVRTLVDDLRASVGRDDALVFIDQEGGRVQRLQPPTWRRAPSAATFGQLAEVDMERALEACHLNSRLLAAELTALDIDVNCLPCLDVRQTEAHDVIGDRAYSTDPDIVTELGRAAADGLLEGGVLPVIKHIPGHGRTRVDSHLSLPVVDADIDTLERVDFAPFRALAELPIAMTGHILFQAIDAQAPATTSATVASAVIREHMGFNGLLLSDDISMQALSGDIGARSQAALAAGCDVVLHCNGDETEMRQVADAVDALSGDTARRAAKALAYRSSAKALDVAAAETRLDALLAPMRTPS